MSENQSPTPDAVDVKMFMSLPKSEAMDRFGLTEDKYDKAMKDMAEGVAAIENRRGQAGVVIPALVGLGGHLDEGFSKSGLVAAGAFRSHSGLLVARRPTPIERIKLGR